MASERCSKCGAFGPAGTAYCAFCGTPFRGQGAGAPLAAGAPPTTFGPPSPGPSGWYPALGTTGAPSVPSPEARSAERRALTYVIWGAILILVAGAFSVGADLTTTVSGGALHLGTPFLLASLGAGACEFLVVVLFYLAFRSLAARDPAFSTPSRLALLLSVAIALLLAALYPLVTMLNQLETCITSAGSNQTAQVACISGGSFAAILALVVVAGILALVGYIGLLIGVWRLGGRYHNSYFKVGAVLLIIPFLNLVGGGLILLAARAARDPPRAPPPF